MKFQKTILLLVGFVLIFALALGNWESVKAAMQSDTITKPLVYHKSLDISLGRGGVYFPSSNYTGKAVLTRIESENTEKLNFSQRWLDIRLFDSNGKEYEMVYGYVYVYFILNVYDHAAWDKGKLGIYHYNEAKESWEECNSNLFVEKCAPYGRLGCQITDGFGLFGLAIDELTTVSENNPGMYSKK
ncbi:MAG: hypothetical protein MUO76_12425 [Anaerolineaceae bacterium]|nr:hypothetical protein [Anaerolineaceae bacterium]